jgi:hypothetical protein
MLKEIPDALRFNPEAYKHGKAIAASGEGVELVKETKTGELLTGDDAEQQASRSRTTRTVSLPTLPKRCQPPIP